MIEEKIVFKILALGVLIIHFNNDDSVFSIMDFLKENSMKLE
jgi:hypothetical protein